MNVLIVYAHPSPASFNAALRDAAAAEIRAAGHQVTISDLYGERFGATGGPDDFATPVAEPFHYQAAQKAAALNDGFAVEVAREQARLKWADVLILQFPIWWGGPPAILKGWIDRVNAYGVTYVDGTRFAEGLFRGRRSLVSVTTGGTPQRFSDAGEYGPIDRVLWPIQQLFLGYLGYDRVPPQVAYAVARADDAARRRMIGDLRARVRALLDPPFTATAIAEPQALREASGDRDWTSKR